MPTTLTHPRHRLWGLASPSFRRTNQLNSTLGRRATILEFFQDWTTGFHPNVARDAWRDGALPMITWEPWNASHGTVQHAYSLAEILAGHYDGYIRRYARAVKAYRLPVALRFAHEMNGWWYPWGVLTDGMHNTPRLYVEVWRHVWNIFHAVGAKNVIWVWSVNVLTRPAKNLLDLYPGPRYVTWVGISGYFYNQTRFRSVFDPTLAALQKTAWRKPWVITETGVAGRIRGISVPAHTEMYRLVTGMLAERQIIGLVYFDMKGPRTNWTFQSKPGCVSVLRSLLRSSRWLSRI